jgi:hypothetical protein
MSEELSSSENALIESYNNQLRTEMPEQCIPMYKKFMFCKTQVTDYLHQTMKRNAYIKHFGQEGQKTFGCTEEYNEFSTCYVDFKNQYVDLKNYVSLIEGKPHMVVPGPDEIFRQKQKEHALTVHPLGILDSRLV